MSDNGKPAETGNLTAPDANTQQVNSDAAGAQGDQTTNTANPADVQASGEVLSYLKGLGMEGVKTTPELVKLAEAGLKQKSSVSRLSLEKEQLLARLESQGKSTAIDEPQQQQTQEEQPQQTTAPAGDTSNQTLGVTDNDLFRLSQNIANYFPELVKEAEDGSLFRELRQLGYFKASGINEREVHNYLSQKNAQLKELRELREFKEEHSRPNSNANPAYNPQPGLNMDGPMNEALAKNIVYANDTQNKRYQEAVRFLQQGIINHNVIKKQA